MTIDEFETQNGHRSAIAAELRECQDVRTSLLSAPQSQKMKDALLGAVKAREGAVLFYAKCQLDVEIEL